MDVAISAKISTEWKLAPEIIKQYEVYFRETIKPIIKANYLSHLVTTIENMVNDKKMVSLLNEIEISGVDQTKLRSLLASRTFRLYSIIREPVKLKRRATTRHHPSGAIIYYNSDYDEKAIRILIAHELGHIVNKELFENVVDSEQTANLFAYIAMEDKNKFYTDECEQYIAKSDIEIFNDIVNICSANN